MSSLGCLIIDVLGTELMGEDREILNHPLVGGVILFARHYQDRQQLTALCQSIRACRKKPILIMVDQEGGRVQRFINEFTKLPPMGKIGQLFNQDPTRALVLAEECGYLMALEVMAMDIDFSLAPILDLNKGLNSVVGERAFHSQPEVVTQLASAFIKGMTQAGMAATGKHFPGHGNVTADSHLSTPIDLRPFSAVEQEDLIPFKHFVDQGIPAIMSCHITFPQVDDKSVTFSSIWLKKILRDQLNFKGVIFSDDLNMEGANISAFPPDRIIAAREAGCDFAFLCNNRPGVIQALDTIPENKHQLSEIKWRPLQAKLIGDRTFKHNALWLKAYDHLQTI